MPADAATVLALVAAEDTDAALAAARAMITQRTDGPPAIREVTALLSLSDLLQTQDRSAEAIELSRYVVERAGVEAHAKAAARRIEAMTEATRRDDLAATIDDLATVGDAIAAAKRHAREGAPELAIAAAERAVALTESRRTLNELAATYRRTGRVGDAERTFATSLDRWPAAQNAPAALGLAAILVDRGRPTPALALTDAAIAADPDGAPASAHALRGRILLQLSRGAEAEAALATALAGRNAQARRLLEEQRDLYEERNDHRSAQRLDALLGP